MSEYKKVFAGSEVISTAVSGRKGKVLGLNKAGFYTVRWYDASDSEGMRCVQSGEVKQYRRNEFALVSNGKLDDLTSDAAVSEENLLEESDNVIAFKPSAHDDSPTLTNSESKSPTLTNNENKV